MPASNALRSLAGLIQGRRIFIPGSSGEPTAFLEAAGNGSDLFAGSTVVTSFIAGINSLDLQALAPTLAVISFFPLSTKATNAENRTRVIPISYFEIDGFLRRQGLDVTVVQVSPPDRAGRCSLGPCVEFTPVALAAAPVRIGVINPFVPRAINAPSVDFASFTATIDADPPLHGIPGADADPVTDAIARNVCRLIEDGDTLQTGIGKIPGQILARLTDRRALRVRSGIVTPAVRELFDAGALAETDAIMTGSAIGDAEFYRWIANESRVRIAEIRETHDPARIMAIPRFIAINSAIEVDLQGQCNAEVLGGKAISAAGGLPDFTSAARRSIGGLSIVTLPAADKKGLHSRIVAGLGEGAPVSIPRHGVDFVVTEHGVAELRDKTGAERAAALIAVAAPQFRAALDATLGRTQR